MNRYLFNAAVWLAFAMAAVALYTNWTSYEAFFEYNFPNYGRTVAIVFTTFLGALGILVQAQLADLLVPSVEQSKDLTPEARRKEAEAAAVAALNRGDNQTAMKLYERVGLYHSALQIAEQIRDRPTLIRLYTKLGRYDRARKLHIEEGDFEGAANCSVLMGEIAVSRQYYRKAAEAANPRVNPRAAAHLWNRAQELHKAAALFEEAGELDAAAECYDLMGDSTNARRCLEQYKAMKAFEAKSSVIRDPKKEADIAADKVRSAAIMRDMGDFFAAADLYRQAEQHEEAAKHFEKIEEWERAARSYEAAGRNDKAAECRKRIQPKTYQPPETFGSTLVSMPNLDIARLDGHKSASAASSTPVPQVAFAVPAALPQVPQFQALSANAPIFVTVSGMVPQGAVGADGTSVGGARMMVPGTSMFGIPSGARSVLNPAIGLAQEKLAQALRRGKIREAAKHARVAEDHLLAAVLLEQTGDLTQAAEVYKQIGRFTEAADCMARHGDFLEAARLAIAIKQHFVAIKHLLRGISRDPDGHLAVALAEVFLALRNQAVAARVFRRYVATNGLRDTSHAEVAYRFVTLFQDAGADALALDAVRALIGAGAQSPKLIELEAQLSLNTGENPKPGGISIEEAVKNERPFRELHSDDSEEGSGSTTRKRGEIPSSRAFGEKTRTRPKLPDYAKLSNIHNQATLVGASPQADRNPATGFDFSPPSDVGPRLIYLRDDDKTGRNTDMGVSLFGRPSGSGADGDDDPYSPANRYELKNELGRGGMGVIYEAIDTVLNRPVALKFILKGEGTTRDEFAQFLLEARAIARLTHPNIITIYDIGMMKSKHYIAMELVTGGALSNRLRERGRFSLVESLRIFVEIARGLQAAHAHGIVHRDVKPGNILLADKDTVRIVDFGLATLHGKSGNQVPGDAAANKYRHAGTPGFMAPEQIRGSEPHPTADIYALGVIFYFMLTGEPPHKSVNPVSINDVLAFQLKGIMPKLRDLRPDAPEAFEHLYRYCTVANPSDRYQCVDQFLGDAEKYLKALT